MKQASGLLLYRMIDDELEVLLVHPSGSYNAKSPWGIPKGLQDAGESLEDTARRETWEETGVRFDGPLKSMGFIEYRHNSKRVHCFAACAPDDAEPRCASWEVDRAEFVPMERADEIIHQDQAAFLARLRLHLANPAKRDGDE